MGKSREQSTVIPEDSQALEKLNAELRREIEERVRTEKALKESEERYRSIPQTIQENSPDIIYCLDPEGRIWAENNEAGGTSFFVHLPLVRQKEI